MTHASGWAITVLYRRLRWYTGEYGRTLASTVVHGATTLVLETPYKSPIAKLNRFERFTARWKRSPNAKTWNFGAVGVSNQLRLSYSSQGWMPQFDARYYGRLHCAWIYVIDISLSTSPSLMTSTSFLHLICAQLCIWSNIIRVRFCVYELWTGYNSCFFIWRGHTQFLIKFSSL